MNAANLSRQVLSLNSGFFNDGAWYVLSSTSRGGSELNPTEIIECLQSTDPSAIQDLLQKGICLPLHFDGDCALDHIKIVLGELNPREQEEWIGRIRSRLEIPCGEFLLIGGGGCEEDWEAAIKFFEPQDMPNFSKIKVEPGTYLVELYAFANSMTFNVAWDGMGIMRGIKETPESLSAWWETTRPGEPYPEWLEAQRAKKFRSAEELGLVEYLVRLRPWRDEDNELPLPKQVPDVHWCGIFEYRRSIACPRGLRREEHLDT